VLNDPVGGITKPTAATRTRSDGLLWLRDRLAAMEVTPGRGGVENNHFTDFEYPPPPPRVCMSIQPEGKSCTDLGRVFVLNDPAASQTRGVIESKPSAMNRVRASV